MRNSKGQGLSLDIIVVAAIVLIVMVVVITIFLGRAGTTGKELSSCTNKGGDCKPWTVCDKDAGWTPVPGATCPLTTDTKEQQICCIHGII